MITDQKAVAAELKRELLRQRPDKLLKIGTQVEGVFTGRVISATNEMVTLRTKDYATTPSEDIIIPIGQIVSIRYPI